MSDAPSNEYFSIGQIDGDLVLNNLLLTGWGADADTLRLKTYKGRLWGRITQDGGDDIFELWSRPEFTDATKRVAVSDPITAVGPITFDEDNSSGFSGSVDVDYTIGQEQLFDVVVSYASEEDVAKLYEGLTSELTNDQYAGQDVRFEALLKMTKRDELDQWLWERYNAICGDDSIGRPHLALIADPTQLALVHARLCVAALYERRSNGEQAYVDLAKSNYKLAKTKFENMRVQFDLTRNKSVDEKERPDRTLDRA